VLFNNLYHSDFISINYGLGGACKFSDGEISPGFFAVQTHVQ
jgi:hypothetical protein